MLRVLLVDDEPLVRAGILHSIRWSDYGMQVTAQAGSVAEAILRIQESEKIDVVFTDVIMPEKNGLDLLTWLHDNRPDITPVILSYHNEFGFIQEALRLGTADYIIKTELNQDGFHQTMENIALKARQRLRLQKRQQPLSSIPYASAIAIRSLLSEPAAIHPQQLSEAAAYYTIGQNTWLLLYSCRLDEQKLSDLEQAYDDSWVILHFSQVQVSIADLMQTVNLYFSRDFFYERLPQLKVYSLDPTQILHYRASLTGPEYMAIEEELSTIRWIWSQERMEEILGRICAGRLSQSAVYNLFYCVQSQWHRFFPQEEIPVIFPLHGLNYWHQWLDWINNFRTFATTQSKLQAYSPDIIMAMQSLLLWIDDHFMSDVSLANAAQRVNLSTSYLSRIFRDFTGCNYSEYVRNTRISYAKKMLSHSDLPVRRIAELCGFQDQFYFDKVFKKSVGSSPSNYRQQHSISGAYSAQKP